MEVLLLRLVEGGERTHSNSAVFLLLCVCQSSQDDLLISFFYSYLCPVGLAGASLSRATLDKQPVVKYVANLHYHTKEIVAYFMFAIPQRRAL